jgi:hypothetical protein
MENFFVCPCGPAHGRDTMADKQRRTADGRESSAAGATRSVALNMQRLQWAPPGVGVEGMPLASLRGGSLQTEVVETVERKSRTTEIRRRQSERTR